MRKDMHKVIIETGRSQGYGKFKGKKDKYSNRDIWEISPGGKVGIKRPYRNNPKQQNDKLSPLRRYLRSQVGRLWDDVYSDICKVFKGDGVLQDHIKRHVFDLIETKTKLVDGEVWSFEDTPRKLEARFQMYGNEGTLYVHPETGIVSIFYNKNSRKKQREEREKKRLERVREAGYRQLAIKFNNLWYLVQLDNLPQEFEEVEIKPFYKKALPWKKKVYRKAFDVFLGKLIGRWDYIELENRHFYYGSEEVYAKHKRLLGKRELKRLGLKNNTI